MLSFSRFISRKSPVFNRSFTLNYTPQSLLRIRLRKLSTMQSGVKVVINDVIKSEGDKRLYRGLELNNGMKVMLISDEETDKSAAAMDVHIGTMSDPENLPGLAHFCEHMLFLGTEKYPEENEYSKFLSEHGGSSNAFTSAEHTNYYFDVAPEHFKGALDRFSQFFRCPLFTASATDREVNAVNSENDKNLANDVWRLHQLERSTSDSNHPYSRFGTGNKFTLQTRPKELGLDPREELLKFHKKYYSSNIMGVSVLGKESLDELHSMVLEYFSEVENKNVSVPEWPVSPYGVSQLKKSLLVVPVKDVRNLFLLWPIPDLHKYYKSFPGHYLGHLIGHEGQGSLLSELKDRGWVNQLVSGQKGGAKGFDFFYLNVDLTEDGIEHVDDIIILMYQYIALTKHQGPQEWIFRECQDLSKMHFRFKDKDMPRQCVLSVAGCLQEYPLGEVLSCYYLYDEWKPDLIDMLLSKLTPENMRIGVVGKKFEGKTDQKENWYGTDYTIENISEDLLNKLENPGFNENLKSPNRNEFIPTDFELKTRDLENSKFPKLVKNTPLTRLWYQQDNEFLLPKSFINVDFYIPITYVDPLHSNLMTLFTKLFNDSLNEYTYDAELAGLSYSLVGTMCGMFLKIKGYSHKQPVLLGKILEKLTSFEVDPKRYEILKEEIYRSLINFKAEESYQHAMFYSEVIVQEQLWTKQEKLDALQDVTIDKLRAFVLEILSRMSIECLVYGNEDLQSSQNTVDIIENIIQTQSGTKAICESQKRSYREIHLPDASSFMYTTTNDVHKSCALQIYYQTELQNTQSNALLELFAQVIHEPCFDTLRTKQQLGYIVSSSLRRSNGVQGLRFIVQSHRKPDYVEKRVEAFLHSMENYIENMTEEDFNKHLTALITKKLEKPKKMNTQNQRHWGEIVCQQYNFDRENIEAAHLKTLTKKDLMNFYKEWICYSAPRRHKLSTHIVSTAEDDNTNDAVVDDGEEMEAEKETLAEDSNSVPEFIKAETIEDISEFKKDMSLFPRAKPFMKIPVPADTANF